MSKSLIFSFFIIIPSFAGSVSQTDWSGGPYFWGPVLELSCNFLLDTDVNWSQYEGSLLLSARENVIVTNLEDVSSVSSADIDGDGDVDLLGAAYYDYEIIWWENVNGSGETWSKHVIDGAFFGARAVYSADINGDGNSDVLGAGNANSAITWWENVGGSGVNWLEHVIDGDLNSANSIYSADIDGDGYADVLGAASSYNEIAWWQNVDGSGEIWQKHVVDSNFNYAYSVYSADIDGDGDADVLGASPSDNEITWWENVDGSGETWSKHVIDGDFGGASTVHSTDIDGDGDADVLGAAYYYGKITWWENTDGSGETWSKHVIDGAFGGATSVYSADIDGDGDNDVAGAAWYDDEITWWENVDGSGETWSEHVLDRDFNAAQAVHCADIDGDGDADVLGTALYDDEITWWDMNSFNSSGSLESSLLDTQDNSSWGEITWSADCPSGTEIGFQVRATQTGWEPTMPEWSDILWAPCSLDGILTDGYPYVQYRVVMSTSDLDSSPVLNNVTISWDETCIEEDTSSVGCSTALLPFNPNPVRGNAVIRYSLEEPAVAEFSVYSISGRVVHSIGAQSYPAGPGNLLIKALAPGIYFCRMTACEFTATHRFVVIEQ